MDGLPIVTFFTAVILLLIHCTLFCIAVTLRLSLPFVHNERSCRYRFFIDWTSFTTDFTASVAVEFLTWIAVSFSQTKKKLNKIRCEMKQSEKSSSYCDCLYLDIADTLSLNACIVATVLLQLLRCGWFNRCFCCYFCCCYVCWWYYWCRAVKLKCYLSWLLDLYWRSELNRNRTLVKENNIKKYEVFVYVFLLCLQIITLDFYGSTFYANCADKKKTCDYRLESFSNLV